MSEAKGKVVAIKEKAPQKMMVKLHAIHNREIRDFCKANGVYLDTYRKVVEDFLYDNFLTEEVNAKDRYVAWLNRNQ